MHTIYIVMNLPAINIKRIEYPDLYLYFSGLYLTWTVFIMQNIKYTFKYAKNKL